MPTLTASPAIKAAAAKRGLATAAPTPAQKSLVYRSSPIKPTPYPAPTSAPDPAAPEPAEPKPPSKKQKKSAEYMARQRAFQASAREKLLPMLREVFPMAFCLPPLPLAIGIHKDILEIAGDTIDPADLSAFLKYWCSRRSYLINLWRGMGRRNLDGSIAGVPTIKERDDAGRGVWRERYREIQEPAAPVEEKVKEGK